MSSWITKKTELYESTLSVIRQQFADATCQIVKSKLVVSGDFPVLDDQGSCLDSYKLGMVFPDNYPKWVPEVYMMGSKEKWLGDRHIEMDGRACLCLPHEVLSYLPEGVSFEAFWQKLVYPWLIGQVHFDELGKWPFGERSHGKTGILEGISELVGINDFHLVEQLLTISVKKSQPKGHWTCPCGSGKRLRDCHINDAIKLRSLMPEQAINFYQKLFF